MRKRTPEMIEHYVEAAKKRWQDPAYRALMSERLRAGAKRRFARPGETERVFATIKKWRDENVEEYSKIQKALAVRPHPNQSKKMKALWSDPAMAKQYLAVIGTNHQPEFLDKRDRLWKFKSTWELAFAMWLDARDIHWFYEPCSILLSDGRRYHPDFFVTEWDLFIEIKAGHRDAEKARVAVADGHPVRVLQGKAEIADFMREWDKA